MILQCGVEIVVKFNSYFEYESEGNCYDSTLFNIVASKV